MCGTSHFLWSIIKKWWNKQLTWFCKIYVMSHIVLWCHPKFRGVFSTKCIKTPLMFP
jgi:hypothetical protein